MKDFEIRCDESRLETTNLIYGKFTLGPFLPGQATTFGNALRRSLLAELSGLAITAFEIIGVMQEFSTLPGLRESILDLSLNLKQIVLTGVLPHSTPPIGFLNIRGPAIIKAIDLKLPAGVYCASPNQYIATLGSNGMLHLKFLVSVGKGYSIQPYSIYRSLSKIRLQPASNFDNTNESFPLAKYQEKQLEETSKRVDSYSEALPHKALRSFTPSFARPPLHSACKASTINQSKTSSVSFSGSNKDSSTYQPTLSSLNGLINQKTKKKEFSSIDKARFKEGTNYKVEPVEHEITNSQTFNPLLTSKKSKDLEDPLISFSYPDPCGEKRFASYPLEARHSKSSDTCLAPLAKRVKKQMLELRYINEKNSSYINIQTQLFQRITPHQVLPIDAVFTPVSQVNFLTEVNDRFETARENIVLEIWTNGSIHPKRALEEATLSLVQNFDTLLKKIQQASSFYKGLRYWTYLQPFKSSLKEKTNGKAPFNSVEKSLPCVAGKDGVKGVSTQQKRSTDSLPSRTRRACEAAPSRDNKDSEALIAQRESNITSSSKTFTPKELETEELIEKIFKKDLPHSIYNLDIGNLNLSLQTFIFLKKAKIHTLLQLLTQLSDFNQTTSFSKKKILNEKIVEELNHVIKQFGYEE